MNYYIKGLRIEDIFKGNDRLYNFKAKYGGKLYLKSIYF